MKNPLRKRYLRELKSDFGKYLVIALFMIMLIGAVSGYLVAASSIETTFYEGVDKYNLEDGHIVFSKVPEASLLEEIEEKGDLKLYGLEYIEEDTDSEGTTLRIFRKRTDINTECLMEGAFPSADDEIAVDRLYAQYHDLSIGDTIPINGKDIKVSGLVALVDYGCLFENNSDMMFSIETFGVGVMTDEGYEALNSAHVYNCYAWKYNTPCKDETEKNSRSENLMDVLEDVIKKYDTSIVQAEVDDLYAEANELSDELQGLMDYEFDEEKLLEIDGYQAEYDNKAINYCMDDMGGDKPMFILFDYIVVVIIAFVFAVTISNTIAKEAGVIGTLRASGYTRGELTRHYLFMPLLVTVIASIIGNILGYTVFVDMMKEVFYNSFSLATYESLFNSEAFMYTTVIPLILMVIINLVTLTTKLKLSPIKFLRHELAAKKKRRAVLLNKKWPFLTRFRLRILFQNIPAYITLAFGIFFGGVICVFGLMFGPLLTDFGDLIVEEKISDYQYVLMDQIETETEGAEKYCITGLDSMMDGYLTDEVSIYGIEEDSSYITKDIPEGEVLVSEGILKKYGLNKGDTLTLKDQYSDKTYDFKIADTYSYSASLAVFMNRNEFNECFDEEDDYFTGYFSNNVIEDIESDDIATMITASDLKKVADQLNESLGSFMELFKYFGILSFIFVAAFMMVKISRIEKSEALKNVE